LHINGPPAYPGTGEPELPDDDGGPVRAPADDEPGDAGSCQDHDSRQAHGQGGRAAESAALIRRREAGGDEGLRCPQRGEFRLLLSAIAEL